MFKFGVLFGVVIIFYVKKYIVLILKFICMLCIYIVMNIIFRRDGFFIF